MFCKKTMPWSYESECRIIVTIDKSLVSDKRINTVAIPFRKDLVSKLMDKTYNNPNNTKGRYCRSSLEGKINWNI